MLGAGSGTFVYFPGRAWRVAIPVCRSAAHPEHIRSDNGPEFVAKAVRRWLAQGGG